MLSGSAEAGREASSHAPIPAPLLSSGTAGLLFRWCAKKMGRRGRRPISLIGTARGFGTVPSDLIKTRQAGPNLLPCRPRPHLNAAGRPITAPRSVTRSVAGAAFALGLGPASRGHAPGRRSKPHPETGSHLRDRRCRGTAELALAVLGRPVTSAREARPPSAPCGQGERNASEFGSVRLGRSMMWMFSAQDD
jgi:hypothetical protein